jgi:hypothetical protein
MMAKKRAGVLVGAAAALALAISGTLAAQRPIDNVNASRHPNLAAAQRLSSQAYRRIIEAQEANEWDMNGHAQHAKELLDEVNRELSAAAEAANRNHK